ncbi:MAG: hypothetical protein AB1652_09715 [Bacillota bacterium]
MNEELSLQELIRKINEIFDYKPKVTFYNEMILLQYDGRLEEVEEAKKLLDQRGADYSISYGGHLLTFAIVPVNGGELDVEEK